MDNYGILKTKQSNNIYFYSIIVCIFIAFFEESKISWLSLLGLISLLFVPAIICIYFFKYPLTLNKQQRAFVLIFGIYIILQVCFIRIDHLYISLTAIYRMVSLLLFSLFLQKFDFDSASFRGLNWLVIFTIIVGFVSQQFLLPNTENYLIGNQNTVGVLYFTIVLLYFVIKERIDKRIFYLVIFSSLVLIVISNTRTALFLLVIFFVYLLIMRIFFKSSRVFWVFPVSLFVIVIFILFYYNIKTSELYDLLNSISQTLFHKNFDSGRPDLWHMAVDAVGENWLFGLGTGFDLSEVYPQIKTPHSSYFDIFMQNGFAGLSLFCISLFLLFTSRGKWKNNKFNLMLLVILFVILFYNGLGIIFTKPRSSIGLLMWGLISIRCKETPNDQCNRTSLQCSSIYR